jgi:hypothetical protein
MATSFSLSERRGYTTGAQWTRAVALLTLMLWGARQDGREQRRLERRLRQRR